MTHVINPSITPRLINVVKGTILGGSSLVKSGGSKNYYLSMRSKNGLWLDYKASELSVFSSEKPMTIEKTNRWHSLCYPFFSEMRSLFYKNKKRHLEIKTLDNLSDIAFMIWFGDAGTIKNDVVIFNTHIWDKKGTETICEYLNLAGYNCEIFLERKHFRIKFDLPSSRSVMALISHQLPHSFSITKVGTPKLIPAITIDDSKTNITKSTI